MLVIVPSNSKVPHKSPKPKKGGFQGGEPCRVCGMKSGRFTDTPNMSNVNVGFLMGASGSTEHPKTEGKVAVKAVATLLNTATNGVAVLELTAKKNCGTIGYLVVNAVEYNGSYETTGIVVWKAGRDKATIEKIVNKYKATLGLESVKPKDKATK